jgi:preprotein translocase subunit SecG
MYIFISVLIFAVSVLLGLVVLVQNPKGGGLAANFSGAGSQFMGVRQTADFLEKASWGLAIALLVLSLTATMVIPREYGVTGAQKSEIMDKVDGVNTAAPIDFQAPAAEEELQGE